ncbi:uncharacterized protein LOC124126752 [Haliotis rufescens]|uniref:uncharacterized protein LOC124126752 n=1 Tax=Haliotis rufescens TaxID=6454 RepID=UPI001EAFFCCB|nr:uncharacterized protein LOC124126752 [Haliotis rufescens]
MTMFDSRFVVVLLGVIAPLLGCGTLENELATILGRLQAAKEDFKCIFNISDEQCPCLDGTPLSGNETIADVGCFEAQLEVLTRLLCDLTVELENVTESQPDTCPHLEGCASLVAACSCSDVAVVDPVGTIQPSLQASENVSGIVVDGSIALCPAYTIYYFSEHPLHIVCWVINSTEETETVIANETILAEDTGVATGIAYHNDKVFIALDYSGVPDVLLSVDTVAPFTVTPLATLTCKPGKVRSYEGRVYFSDCKAVRSVTPTGGDERTEMQFSLSINSFDFLGDDTIVICDEFGGLWHYSPASRCFTLIDCRSSPCADVKLNQCSSLVYVAYPDNAELDVFESTLVANGTLAYTTSVPGACPTIDFEPNCARPIDGNNFSP